MKAEEKKREAAQAAMRYVRDGMIVGVGTGSTVNHFIDCLLYTSPSPRDRTRSRMPSSA